MADYYAGRVQAVVFGNDAQSFYVMKMSLDGDDALDEVAASVTVRGNVPGLEVKAGTWFGFEAKWENHEKYGRQLVIKKAPVLKDGWDTETALKMLESHGVGIRTCNALYDHFGDGLMDALKDADELQKVSSISKFSALHIVSRWQTIRAMFQSLEFLGDLRLPKNKVEQIYSHFGDDTEKALSEDPWSLVQIDGISFDQADEVARRLGLNLASETRLRGAALYTCKSKRGMGHLYLSSGELVQGITSAAPEVKKAQIAHVLKELHDENLMVLDNKTRPGTMAIYEPWFHSLEKESAVLLAERQEKAQFDDEGRAEYLELLGTVGPKSEVASQADGADLATVARTAILEWSEHGNLKLAANQLNGAVNALVEPVSVLTGLPGTGKTTTLKVVVKVLQDANVPFLLVAPTGIAAKRLTSVTGADASTIHRAFGAKGMDTDNDREATYAGIIGASGGAMTEDGSKEFWGFSSNNPHPAKVVIVDESSMVDQHLLFRLLTCTARDCRVVFVGDAAQLPSVGPGNVLRDVISSGFFPVVDLQEIFRQDEASDIVIAAHAINRGDVPKFEHRSKDFIVVEVRSEDQILETLTSTVQKLYDRNTNFQVLSPRHSGTLGVTNLNLRIRELLNPKTPGLKEMRLGPETIREGDRVMVSKNNYRYEIFNGDVGKIVRLDQKGKIVTFKIHGPPAMRVEMSFKDAPKYLRMAYCVTVHKSQGQEYDVILMPWSSSFRHQLQRNLLYTAITRARKKVILVGHPEAVAKAIGNNKVDARNTLFPERLGEVLGELKSP
jgi:exodeoxyribonuclease V alpha subunit